MASPNPQLEAALTYFSTQIGIAPEQISQLRDAISTDSDRLQQLNQQAAAGQLKGFALDTSSSTAAHAVGTYDKTTGVVTLPVASFQPIVGHASLDLKATVGVLTMSVEFAYKSYTDTAGVTQTVSQDMVSNLQATFNSSPVLAAQLKAAVRQDEVQHFSLLSNAMAAGASYDGIVNDGTPKGINLPALGLQTKRSTNRQGRYNADEMAMVLGHEIQHGLNNTHKTAATRDFVRGLRAQAKVSGPTHDYTDELKTYIQASREDEASAHIAGWNALLSLKQQGQPNGNGLDLMLSSPTKRVLDFIQEDPLNKQKAIPKAGLAFNPDGSLSPTPANVAAMGKHYFDRPSSLYAQQGQRAVGLGEHRPNPTADYTNYYGVWAVEQVITAEERSNVRHQGAKPQIVINMARIGLKEDLLEMEGLDLGNNRLRRPYMDSSQTPARASHFDHTQDASQGHDHQYVPIAPVRRIPPSGDPTIDRWINALQDGDDAAAKAVEDEFARSATGQYLWNEGLAEAQAAQDRREPWRMQARETSLYQQALQQLDVQPGQYWMHEQRENLAGVIAMEARRAGLSQIDALFADEKGLRPMFNHPHNHYLDRYGAAVDPTQAAEQPLQQSMQQLADETMRQAQQALLETQQKQQRGMSL